MQYFEDYIDKMQQQAELDKQLHMRALANPHRFDKDQRHLLNKDRHTKEEFQAVLSAVKSGQLPDKQNLFDLIKKLHFDRSTHYKYMNQPPSANTGDPHFHKHWISVYDGWIRFLKKLIKQHENYNSGQS